MHRNRWTDKDPESPIPILASFSFSVGRKPTLAFSRFPRRFSLPRILMLRMKDVRKDRSGLYSNAPWARVHGTGPPKRVRVAWRDFKIRRFAIPGHPACFQSTGPRARARVDGIGDARLPAATV